jgi:hypothetical protein
MLIVTSRRRSPSTVNLPTWSRSDPFGFRQILHLGRTLRRQQHHKSSVRAAANTVDRGQRDLGMLVVGYIYPCDAGHRFTPKCETYSYTSTD